MTDPVLRTRDPTRYRPLAIQTSCIYIVLIIVCALPLCPPPRRQGAHLEVSHAEGAEAALPGEAGGPEKRNTEHDRAGKPARFFCPPAEDEPAGSENICSLQAAEMLVHYSYQFSWYCACSVRPGCGAQRIESSPVIRDGPEVARPEVTVYSPVCKDEHLRIF